MNLVVVFIWFCGEIELFIMFFENSSFNLLFVDFVMKFVYVVMNMGSVVILVYFFRIG